MQHWLRWNMHIKVFWVGWIIPIRYKIINNSNYVKGYVSNNIKELNTLYIEWYYSLLCLIEDYDIEQITIISIII